MGSKIFKQKSYQTYYPSTIYYIVFLTLVHQLRKEWLIGTSIMKVKMNEIIVTIVCKGFTIIRWLWCQKYDILNKCIRSSQKIWWCGFIHSLYQTLLFYDVIILSQFGDWCLCMGKCCYITPAGLSFTWNLLAFTYIKPFFLFRQCLT